MSDPSQPECPGDWILQTYSTAPRRLCGSGTACLSAVYSTYGISYSHVCGRAIGYQLNAPDGFGVRNPLPTTADEPYLDGVSITHGPSGARQHIWSFAVGLTEPLDASYPILVCPCANRASLANVPTFLGNDYFCESGNPGSVTFNNVLFASDPLWDGQGCGSPPCCALSYPPGVMAPWFCKQLPQATADDIEVRICRDEPTSNEDTPVELVELYIR